MDRQLDPMVLPETAAWRAEFEADALGPFDFVAQRVPLSHAIVLGHVLWPRFTVDHGYVILAERHQPEALEQWRQELDDDRGHVERVVNHVHVWDLVRGADDDASARGYVELAELIAATWRCALSSTFPERSFTVEMTNDPDDYGPTVTFWSNV